MCHGDRVSGRDDEKVLEVNSGESHTMGMHLMPLTLTLKKS